MQRIMIHLQVVLQILYFFLPAYLANMSPVLVRRRLNDLAVPIDGGKSYRGKRLLGDHKTWRGLLAGAVVGIIAYELQRFGYNAGVGRTWALIDYTAHPLLPGLLMGLGAGVGDLVKSFFKRRIDIKPGASWPVFDQLDFFIGAYLFVSPISSPPLLPTVACLPLIFLCNVASEVAGYWLGFKETWI
jgi:CDP-2,3-bis-(O-geranylgeranyl)-sn-glycerol synthase